MAGANDEATFTFSWLALKLLGRGLYSNPWSALSELVANGLDAGAENVYVYVDARVKANAIVEVIDDGSGMSRDDISTYVQVGHDKRKHAKLLGVENPEQFKGRKGIGKLAALFLSQHFFLQTRHAEGATSWELDARDRKVLDADHPKLMAAEATPPTANDQLWIELASGTRITLLDVDLTGYGAQAINALGSRLANQFLLPDKAPPQILLSVRTKDSESAPTYSAVHKSIAFGNFAELAQRFVDPHLQPPELAEPPVSVSLPAKGLPGDVYTHTPGRASFPLDPDEGEAWNAIAHDVDRSNQTYKGIKYSLTGWIGAHATIDNRTARTNDSRFVKNRYYNPAQIRVYVRGKLATDHLLSQLGLTGTYVNYIEGEISFDLLDHDDLPDIATSNRQDFDETDNRVMLLRALVRPIVRSLIQRRMNLARAIGEQISAEKDRREAAGKKQFSDQLREDLETHPEISDSVRDELHMVITNKIEGDVLPKQTYRVFISHARADRPFATFIDELLQHRGASKDEIFYTSREGSVDTVLDDRALGAIIKESITDANTLIFYMTSHNFLDSQFCLFEGGAGWATRAVSEYLKLNVDYDSIPKFLTNGKAEVTLLTPGKTIELTPELHNYIATGILNPMIAHLNRGREIAGQPSIAPFVIREAPSLVDLKRLNKRRSDYFDPAIEEHWRLIVAPQISKYLSDYKSPTKT